MVVVGGAPVVVVVGGAPVVVVVGGAPVVERMGDDVVVELAVDLLAVGAGVLWLARFRDGGSGLDGVALPITVPLWL